MYDIDQIYQHEIEINKSKFIGILMPIHEKDAIKMTIESYKISYPKANHYTHAAAIGDRQDIQSISDDGEPQKTAGIPILEVIKHHELTNVLLIVIRYFGGIKLGAGGLIRAYAKCASEVILKAQKLKRVILPTYEITFGYHLIDQIEHYLKDDAVIKEKSFLNHVTYQLVLNPGKEDILLHIKHLLHHMNQCEDTISYMPISKDEGGL